MVSVTMGPQSTGRANEFSRVDEFAFVVFLGDVEIGSGERTRQDIEARWLYLRRTQRSQSARRRLLSMARERTIGELDDEAWDEAKRRITDWLAGGVAALKAAGRFDTPARPVTHVQLKTLAAHLGSSVAEPDGLHDVEASDLDSERHFQGAGRVLTNGLHKAYGESHAQRDSGGVKVELVALCLDAASMARIETAAEPAFNALYDRHKRGISCPPEARRRRYDRLRLATAQPADVLWTPPGSIDWRRSEREAPQDLHLDVESSGAVACKLTGWEPRLLMEELARGDSAGWLRNLPHKPWSLEIPCAVGAEVRPMFPDFVLVRREGDELLLDILKPHDPGREDNVTKAHGLARCAERHGGRRRRVQRIRKRRTAGGAEQFVRLEFNKQAVIEQVLLANTAAQLDQLFDGVH